MRFLNCMSGQFRTVLILIAATFFVTGAALGKQKGGPTNCGLNGMIEYADSWSISQEIVEPIAMTVDINLFANVVGTEPNWTLALEEANAHFISQGIAATELVAVFIPPGQYPMRTTFESPRSNTIYYGGGTLVRENPLGLEANEELIAFGAGGGLCTGTFENITIAGLAFDAKGFCSSGAMIQWNSSCDVTDIHLTNLTFFDSLCPNTLHEFDENDCPSGQTCSLSDDWSINIGGQANMTNFTIENCVHNSPVHQFVASGFKNDSTVDNLEISNNILHGSRSVSISVQGFRDSGQGNGQPPMVSNVLISNNRIYNPWNNAISVGLDARLEVNEVRSIDLSDITVTDNLVYWDAAGDSYSQTESTVSGIRFFVGNGPNDVINNIEIRGNQVVNDGANPHTSKTTNGISFSNGEGVGDGAAPVGVTIIDNEVPNINLTRIEHSGGDNFGDGIHVAGNVLGDNAADPTNANLPSELLLDAWSFRPPNDFVSFSAPIEVDIDTLDICFRMYFPMAPSSGENYYVFYHDEDNFLRLQEDRRLVLRIGGENRKIIDQNLLEENSVYLIQLEGDGAGSVAATYNGVPGNSQLFDTGTGFPASFPISFVGARANVMPNPDDVAYSVGGSFQGNIWDVSIAENAALSEFTGTTQVAEIAPWRDQVGNSHGIPSPLQPFYFDGVMSGLPAPAFPLIKQFDGLDIEFSFLTKDMSQDAYFFQSSNSEFLRLSRVDYDMNMGTYNGRVTLKENGEQHQLITRSADIQERRFTRLRIKDMDESNKIRLETFLNGADVAESALVVDEMNSPGTDSLFSIDSIGGGLSGTPRPFQGAIWDVLIHDNGGDDYDEFYEGAGDFPWDDLLGVDFESRNHATLAPFGLAQFDGATTVDFSTPISVDYQGFEMRFSIRVDDLTQSSYLFYQGSDNYVRLLSSGRIRMEIGGESQLIFTDQLLAGGVYDIQISRVDSGGAGPMDIECIVNGNQGPQRTYSAAPSFAINAFGGEPQTPTPNDAFTGAIWDIRFADDSGDIAAYDGFGVNPWDDTVGTNDGS